MQINYGLNKNKAGKANQHADRVERLVQFAANGDTRAADMVLQSLQALKKTSKNKLQELMQDPEVARISGEYNRIFEENMEPALTQRTLLGPESEHQTRENSEENILPTTHLVLTVGTNALPVWVAWYHLSRKLKPVSTQFVYTSDTRDQKDLLEDYCRKAGAPPLKDIHTSEISPNIDNIHKKITKAFPDTCENLHVHYTGGTQAMGVATVLAMQKVKATLLKDQNRSINTDASYLDPGRKEPPKIVSWADKNLIEDTRKDINPKMNCESCIAQSGCQINQCTQITDFNCNACLRKVADINKFEVAYFTSNHPPQKCPHPEKLSDTKLKAGAAVLEYRFDNMRNYDTCRTQWNEDFRKYDRRKKEKVFCLPSRNLNFQFNLHKDVLDQLQEAYPNCGLCPTTGILSYSVFAKCDKKKDLKEIDAFLNGFWLEYAAYAAFKEELECLGRNNYEIFNNVYVRPKGSSPTDKHFELDVVAVLGYQVVVVSCSVTNTQKQVKLKAMEAYHRAKQLGGDEARAIVLCVANENAVRDVQKELRDETGTKDPLQVWGRCNMIELRKKFRQLLIELHWN